MVAYPIAAGCVACGYMVGIRFVTTQQVDAMSESKIICPHCGAELKVTLAEDSASTFASHSLSRVVYGHVVP